MTKSSDLLNALQTTMKNTSLGSMADSEVYKNGFWSTGQLPIDVALGGGWAKGRMNLSAGESATLKSLTGLSTAAVVQCAGGTAGYIDAENSFNPDWAEEIGVNLSELILIQPDSGEEAIDAAEVLIRQDIDYLCVDSIATLVPKAERDLMLSGKDNVQPARIAALMAIGLRKLNGANSKTCISWISQMRDTIGGMAFGPKSGITGGKSIHYYISQSLMLKKTSKEYRSLKIWNGEKEVDGRQVVGQHFVAEQTKSRFAQPFTQSYFYFDYEANGIDIVGFLIQQGLMEGVITKKGAYWSYNEIDADGVVLNEYKAKSKDLFRELVDNNEEVKHKLLAFVCNKYNLEASNYARGNA